MLSSSKAQLSASISTAAHESASNTFPVLTSMMTRVGMSRTLKQALCPSCALRSRSAEGRASQGMEPKYSSNFSWSLSLEMNTTANFFPLLMHLDEFRREGTAGPAPVGTEVQPDDFVGRCHVRNGLLLLRRADPALEPRPPLSLLLILLVTSLHDFFGPRVCPHAILPYRRVCVRAQHLPLSVRLPPHH
mmetsp:Transcript_43423/g.102557  ORF Transcript_43423/g.102557 Transcript_43423/m.102557 type:complete len:190 (+) Transcript_43423:248-817(+)